MPAATGVAEAEASRLVTEEYRFTVLRCEPAAFGYRFLTDHGPRQGLLIQRHPERVELLVGVYEHLNATGWAGLPRLVRTKSGARFIPLAPKLGLVVTMTLTGRPAPPVGLLSADRLGELLAEFHLLTADFAPPSMAADTPVPQAAELGRRLSLVAERAADLAAYELVARHRLRPGLFDEIFLRAAPGLRASSDEALARLRSIAEPTCGLTPVVCAGEFAWSDLVVLPSATSSRRRLGFTSLRDCLVDTRPSDLARLLGLLGRKTRWRLEPLWAATSAFERTAPLSAVEREFLLAWLAFPYDAWQVADQYYRNKLEAPHREAVKSLAVATRDEPARQACVRALAALR